MTNELWVTSSAQTDAGTIIAAITVIDVAAFTVKSTLTLNAASASFGALIFAKPTLAKAYVSSQTTPDGGFGGEVDEIDVTSHAMVNDASLAPATTPSPTIVETDA